MFAMPMDNFEKLLKKHRTSRFLVLDPEGGWGDHLILMGLEKKLRELRIKYRLLKVRKAHFTNKALATMIDRLPVVQEVLRGVRPDILECCLKSINPASRSSRPTSIFGLDESEEVILLRGGAYLNDIWGGYGALKLAASLAHSKPAKGVIIAPHSFWFRKRGLPKPFLDINQVMHIFCREPVSYKLLKSLQFRNNIHVDIAPDSALYLTKKDFRLQRNDRRHILLAPRLDRESAVKWRTMRFRRKGGEPIVCKDVNLCSDFGKFVAAIGNSSKVFTDRLHVAILGGILNKETYLLPNSYHKNKSAYRFSLNRFPYVNFLETKEFPLPKYIRAKLQITSSPTTDDGLITESLARNLGA